MGVRPKQEPLRVRDGVRYACAGDGLCCTDIHAVGPLDASERETLRAIDQRLVLHRPEHGDHVLVHGEGGRCPFLRADGCLIHNQLGPAAKPGACNRFPLRLTATPHGGRIGTAHSCPCRSLGERPLLTPEAARPSLLDARGRLEAEHRVADEVTLDRRRTVDFDTYARWEGSLFERLERARSLTAALQAPALPRRRGLHYAEIAARLCERQGDSRHETACRWLGQALARELGARPGRWPARPWADSFARAAARSGPHERGHDVFRQWLLDEVWALHWTAYTSARGKLSELASLLRLGTRIARTLRRRGQAPAVAAAEAVMILELGADTPEWDRVRHVL